MFALLVLLLTIMMMMMDWPIMNAMALGSSSLVLSIIDATLGLQNGGGIYASSYAYNWDDWIESSTIAMTNCEISGSTDSDDGYGYNYYDYAAYVRFTIS